MNSLSVKKTTWLFLTMMVAAAAFAFGQDVVLPEGDGKKILETKCTVCHDLSEIPKQHLSKADWTDLIGVMKASGADVTDPEVATLTDYLSKNFGAEGSGGAAAAGDSAGGFPAGEGKMILDTKCTVCHDLTEIPKQHLSKDDWTDLIKVMQASGADVTPAEIATLVDYLSKNFGPEGSAAPKAKPTE